MTQDEHLNDLVTPEKRSQWMGLVSLSNQTLGGWAVLAVAVGSMCRMYSMRQGERVDLDRP